MKIIKKSEAAELLGIKSRTIAFLIDSGVITPEIKSKPGRGSARLLSESNLVQIAMVEPLKNLGLSLGLIGNLYDRINTGGFGNFFTDKSWGVDRELAFIEVYIDDLGVASSLRQVDRNTSGKFEVPFSYIDGISVGQPHLGHRVIYLGNIKNKAT